MKLERPVSEAAPTQMSTPLFEHHLLPFGAGRGPSLHADVLAQKTALLLGLSTCHITDALLTFYFQSRIKLQPHLPDSGDLVYTSMAEHRCQLRSESMRVLGSHTVSISSVPTPGMEGQHGFCSTSDFQGLQII